MATPDDRLARLLKRAAQSQEDPIPPLASPRADEVIRAWRAAQSGPEDDAPLLGFVWRGAAAALTVMLATCALSLSSPESSAGMAAQDESSVDQELAVADSATLIALQP